MKRILFQTKESVKDRGDIMQYTTPPKKLLIINILDVMKRYTDSAHRLSQKEIVDLLEQNYHMKADRKSVKRNLMDLIEFGYPISYTESIRIAKNGEKEIVYSDWYLEHEFDDGELRLLIDSLLFSGHIPYTHRSELIRKLEGLSNEYFHAKVKHINTIPCNRPTNPQLFYTIDVLDEAISTGKQVAFRYCSYDVDKKLHPRKRSDGSIREYIVNPYQLAATNGRYYVICNNDRYDDLAHYRVDRITEIRLLDTPVKPIETVTGKKGRLDLSEHMTEHIFMFTGQSRRVKFRADRCILNDILEDFGMDVEFSDITAQEVTVTARVNEDDMIKWAVQYGKQAVILEPDALRDKVVTVLRDVLSQYEKSQ